MPLEVNSARGVCYRCGAEFSRQKGYFPVCYGALYKGMGHLHICRDCVDAMYNAYLAQCNNAHDAVRQLCRKLDLYWSEKVFEVVERKNTTRSMMTQYLSKITSLTYAGKSYDDTLSEEGTLWSFTFQEPSSEEVSQIKQTQSSGKESKSDTPDTPEIPDDVRLFWGAGYDADMYIDLEERRKYWMSRLPDGLEFDIGTEVIIKQICSLELDINRDRAAGRPVDKSVNALNSLLGSASLKPTQKKAADEDANLAGTPMGVWLYRYENKRPLPEIDDNLKDVNGTKKYIFTWMGHLCKMLGVKGAYTKLYEDEINRLRVEKPEYVDEDDETLLNDFFTNNESG